MKLRIQFFAFLTLVILFPTTMWGQEPISNEALPKIHIIATGGTIAGTSTDIGYDAKDADGPSNLLKAVQTIVKPDAVGKEVMLMMKNWDLSPQAA